MHSKGFLQHLVHLEELLKKFHKVNMKIHPKKCEFVITLVVYFGHIILSNGIMVHWVKVVAILEMPNPIHVHTLRSFIELCNYYKIYVQNFSTIAHPFYALLKRMLLGHGMMKLKKLSTDLRKSFQSSPFWEDLILVRSSFYTLTGMLLVLELFLVNLMKKPRNMLSPMHLEATIRLRTTTLHMRGSALLLYGSLYISGPIFIALISLCIPTTNLSNGWWPTIRLLVN